VRAAADAGAKTVKVAAAPTTAPRPIERASVRAGGNARAEADDWCVHGV
jgi:hypothetical protein